MKNLFLKNRMFVVLGILAFLFVLSFFAPSLTLTIEILLLVFLALLSVDIFLLYRVKNGLSASRILPEKLSNGDENPIQIIVKSRYPYAVNIEIIDEVPVQFQLRDFSVFKTISPYGSETTTYTLWPRERGEYHFGAIHIFASSFLRLISRRFTFNKETILPAYPSFIHLQKYELMAMQNEFLPSGIKKIRRIGHTMEFEQIKEYVKGDDVRTINWKATGKTGRVMVNQYREERAQRVYMLIDKGRTMKMPFGGMTLLDYSINASMALGYIILRKHDRAGMMTFSKKMENIVPADGKPGQLRLLAEALYKIQTNFYESDFNRLYVDVRTRVQQRSLLLLFTNFETLGGLKRQLKYLRAIAKNHLLVVIFFRNSELLDLLYPHKAGSIEEVYDEIIAEKFVYEKKLIRQELLKYGIQSVYTLPQNLNVAVINKYLEIKARGLI